MDEMKECPWCGSLRVESETAEGTPYFYSAVFCRDCDRGVRSDDAIADWNALPRAPKWVEYDGTESTLPPEGKEVLVEISFPGHSRNVTFNTVAKRTLSTLNGIIWWERPMADPWEVTIGNRWRLWPGDNNG
jgi:hypothetical protein